MSFRVYVAAPFGDAPRVRSVHALLRYLRLEPTSQWANEADGPEALEEMPLDVVRAIADRNDADIADADALLVLPRESAGREMYAEVRLAIDRRIPVIWVGHPRCLSAYRKGVTRTEDLSEALACVCELALESEPEPTPIAECLGVRP